MAHRTAFYTAKPPNPDSRPAKKCAFRVFFRIMGVDFYDKVEEFYDYEF